MKKIFIIIIFVTILLTPLVFAHSQSFAQANVNCLDEENAYAPECQTGDLRDLQGLVIRLIYFVWAAGIPLITGVVLLTGYQYMTSGDNSELQESLKQRGGFIVVGMLLFFASQPIAAGIMNFLITNKDSACYENLNTPGFTFFFPTVCNPQTGQLQKDGRVNPIRDNKGGCCVAVSWTDPDTGAVVDPIANPEAGCYNSTTINLPAGPRTIGPELCSTSNGACATGLSCQSPSIDVDLDIFDVIPRIRCGSTDDEGRSIAINDGRFIRCIKGVWEILPK